MRSKVIYKIGIFIIAASFLLAVYNFYFLIFCIPPFVVGLILIWIFGRKPLYKWLYTVAPLILYIPCTTLFLYIYNYSPQKILLIPKKYVGKFRVIYDEPCGKSYSIVDGTKAIETSNGGITILRETYDGKLNFSYRFDGNGGVEIPVILMISDTVGHDMAILAGSSGVQHISTSVDQTEEMDFAYRYSDFYVYQKNVNIDWSDEMLDSLSKATIRNCRANLIKANK